MGKRTKAESAKCPFYCSETMYVIYCNGMEQNSWIHYAFQSPNDCKRYKQKYCRSGWESCPFSALHKEANEMASKYGNVPVVVGSRRYDSKKEAERAQELKLLERAGKVSGLKEQVRYMLVPPQIAPDGRKVQPEYYVADFVYQDCTTGETVVEDVKGHKTDLYKSKKKRMLEMYGIWIKET